ncbi:MAG: helix-turn-helix transcriptional regulator [Planctomycetales bacterium]|nr:helix-turn-helix transcriptional regulator [Planctomycetales bacterium]
MLAKRKMKLNDLSDAVGVSVPNLSILKTGKAKAVRFSTLNAICRVLECQPGDLLEFRDDDDQQENTCQSLETRSGP